MDVLEKLRSKLETKSKEVMFAHEEFKNDYKNSVEENTITNIISGESIAVKPENVFIDDPCKFVDDKFDTKLTYLTKTLYSYQRKSILKLREIELAGKIDNIITNACVLSLPIGAGKSLVYEFISVFYQQVSPHPIILSTDMRSLPSNTVMQFKYYPFYCEKPCYIPEEANAVQVLTHYKQRPITLILTHDHLIEQMRYYFDTDFKKPILRMVNIQYCRTYKECNFSKAGIIVSSTTSENVKYLSEISYIQPFMRVIADDMTDFPLESMRQILASFTIFVSGSGFQRKPEDIPTSYYSLKNVPYQRISVVGKPEETYEGVMRNNITMVKLLGTNNPFSQYAFVSEIEHFADSLFKSSPNKLYPILATKSTLNHYIALAFMLKNIDTMRISINRIEQDIAAGTLDERKVKYYREWKEMIKPTNAKTTNAMYEFIYNIPNENVAVSKVSTIVNEDCLCCGKNIKESHGYGCLSLCCGAFYCSNCLKSMTTHYISLNNGTIVEDKDNYYCCSCRTKNCKFCLNCTKVKDRNIYAFTLVEDFFKEYEDGTLKDHFKVDYYFYMLMYGLTPLYSEGKALRINEPSLPAEIERVYPADQLAIQSLFTINRILSKLKICPRRGTSILFFAAPSYMVGRVENVKNMIIRSSKDEPVQCGSQKVQPISQLDLMFRDSVASLIGLHSNIIAIIVWNKQQVVGDEELQMLGRIYRLNTFDNPLYFYIENSIIEFA